MKEIQIVKIFNVGVLYYTFEFDAVISKFKIRIGRKNLTLIYSISGNSLNIRHCIFIEL